MERNSELINQLLDELSARRDTYEKILRVLSYNIKFIDQLLLIAQYAQENGDEEVLRIISSILSMNPPPPGEVPPLKIPLELLFTALLKAKSFTEARQILLLLQELIRLIKH